MAEQSEPERSETELRVVSIEDERDPLAGEAYGLITGAMWDVHPLSSFLKEMKDRRLGRSQGGDYHLLALVDEAGDAVAAAAGVYLEVVNAGFVTYLAVREDQRRRRLGRELRTHLVEALRAEARRKRGEDLAWVVGEVRRESPWLRTLVGQGRAIPFDLRYFHPWMPRRDEHTYVLYREPVADTRPELPSPEVAALLRAIWLRAYHYPHASQSDTFRYMLSQIEGRMTVGADPEFVEGEAA